MSSHMTQELELAFAVEKVLFRLALSEGGRVPLARAFIELPLALEVLEQEADKAADGTAIFKDEWGDFLSYEFKELLSAPAGPPPSDCPTCGRPHDPETESGARAPLVCEACFRAVKRASSHHDESALERLRHYWKGEDEQDPAKVALVEHEIFWVALKLGGQELTHTSIAAQTRLPAAQVKERLERLAARKYIRVGLMPSGDALAYRFPTNLAYPEHLWRRMQGALITTSDDSSKSDKKARTTGPFSLRPRDSKPPADIPPPPPPPPPKPKLDIKVKDVRDRGPRRPPGR